MLPTIAIGTLTIDTYTWMTGVGILGMVATVFRRRKRVDMSVWQALGFALLMTAVGFAGSLLAGWITWGQAGSKDFFGAILLAIPVIPVVSKLVGLARMQAYDLAAFCMLIVHFFLRIGCLLAGCCEGIVIYVGAGYFQFPYIITMSLANIFIILWLLHIESSGKKHGALYPLFLIAFGIMRIICDAFLYFENLILGMRPAQWYGIFAAAVGCVWLIIYKKRINQK